MLHVGLQLTDEELWRGISGCAWVILSYLRACWVLQLWLNLSIFINFGWIHQSLSWQDRTRPKPRTPNVYGWELVYGAVSIPCHDAFCFTSLYNTPVMTVVESSICWRFCNNKKVVNFVIKLLVFKDERRIGRTKYVFRIFCLLFIKLYKSYTIWELVCCTFQVFSTAANWQSFNVDSIIYGVLGGYG